MNIKCKNIAHKTLKGFIYISVYLFIGVLLSMISDLTIFPLPFFPFRRTITLILTIIIFEHMKLGE